MVLSATNRLLDAVAPETRRQLLRHLEPVDLPVRTLLFEADTAPRYVHFITSGIASTVTVLSTGEMVEVGLVGVEGIAEKVHLLGPLVGMTKCFMQMAGTGLRMEFKRFEQMFGADASLNAAVLRLVQYEALALAQLSACNRLHEMEPRLSRWLLMVSDRTDGSELRLTQEFLGEMLGTRRSTVNITVGSLQKAGLIDYRRSRIRIEGRQGLEGVACECYPIVRRLLRQMYKGLPAT